MGTSAQWNIYAQIILEIVHCTACAARAFGLGGTLCTAVKYTICNNFATRRDCGFLSDSSGCKIAPFKIGASN
jgi:hypothetical protein